MMALSDSPGAPRISGDLPDGAAELSRLSEHLPPLLSVIAGMVDLTGFFTLGNIFTAHVTGNLVVVSAAAVRGGLRNPAQALAIPVFMLAVAACWLVARASDKRGEALARLLLGVQFILLLAVLVISVASKPSIHPHGLMAGIVAMIAVSAMACQYALLRLAFPKVVSTAVMTGNLTNAVLSSMDVLWSSGPVNVARLKDSLRLLGGFLLGCVAAAGAVFFLADWAWLLPVTLSATALAVR